MCHVVLSKINCVNLLNSWQERMSFVAIIHLYSIFWFHEEPQPCYRHMLQKIDCFFLCFCVLYFLGLERSRKRNMELKLKSIFSRKGFAAVFVSLFCFDFFNSFFVGNSWETTFHFAFFCICFFCFWFFFFFIAYGSEEAPVNGSQILDCQSFLFCIYFQFFNFSIFQFETAVKLPTSEPLSSKRPEFDFFFSIFWKNYSFAIFFVRRDTSQTYATTNQIASKSLFFFFDVFFSVFFLCVQLFFVPAGFQNWNSSFVCIFFGRSKKLSFFSSFLMFFVKRTEFWNIKSQQLCWKDMKSEFICLICFETIFLWIDLILSKGSVSQNMKWKKLCCRAIIIVIF